MATNMNFWICKTITRILQPSSAITSEYKMSWCVNMINMNSFLFIFFPQWSISKYTVNECGFLWIINEYEFSRSDLKSWLISILHQYQEMDKTADVPVHLKQWFHQTQNRLINSLYQRVSMKAGHRSFSVVNMIINQFVNCFVCERL